MPSLKTFGCRGKVFGTGFVLGPFVSREDAEKKQILFQKKGHDKRLSFR